MDNQDKLYKQFQNASQKAPEKDFPAMDKIWGRVEEKLDKKALSKETKLWKKIAIAASILLIITLGSQFLKLQNEKNIVAPKTEIVTNEIEKSEIKSNEEKIVSIQKDNSIIRENASEILKTEVSKQQDYANNDKIITYDTLANPTIIKETDEESTKDFGYFSRKSKFDAVGVKRIHEETNFTAKSASSQVIVQKQSPLYIINGKAVTMNENKSNTAKILNDTDIDSIEVLTEPLYIINGVEYSEEDLFGTNPTSPYAPLNKQKILSTKILQGEEATSIYGEKGKKGVVIISTKNNKPIEKKN